VIGGEKCAFFGVDMYSSSRVRVLSTYRYNKTEQNALQDKTPNTRIARKQWETAMHVVVTVGTTRFDDLINTILTPEILSTLSALNTTTLFIQHGASPLPHLPSTQIKIETLKYTTSMTREIQRAELIITHAGTGTILNALQENKKIVVVPNNTLMDGHQTQIAQKIDQMGRGIYCDVRYEVCSSVVKSRPKMYYCSELDDTLKNRWNDIQNLSKYGQRVVKDQPEENPFVAYFRHVNGISEKTA